MSSIERLPVRRRIALLVRARLELLTPHREAVRRAVAAHGLPGNLAGTGRALWRTVDLMWRTAGLGGDAERGLQLLLAARDAGGVLVATLLYWLDDQSRGLRRQLGVPRPPDRGRDADRPRALAARALDRLADRRAPAAAALTRRSRRGSVGQQDVERLRAVARLLHVGDLAAAAIGDAQLGDLLVGDRVLGRDVLGRAMPATITSRISAPLPLPLPPLPIWRGLPWASSCVRV